MQLSKEPTPETIELEAIYADMGLSHAEYATVRSILGRRPNYTEVGLYSVMWSEHCSYKHSKSLLHQFPTTGKRVLQGPGEGAGIVDIGNGQAVVFKMESHNHPSAIEPYQGAATGVGGIIRDVFSMGARPIALLNSLRFGELTTDKVKYLFTHVVAGIAGYGNCVGIPTVGGEVYFEPCYDGNPLVNAMCVGLIDQSKIQQGIARGVGNSVVYVGASTGRDGIHGATFASEELNETSESKRPAVQVGDPFMEKLLMEACLELVDTGALTGMQDMGAAGLASSSSEMASKAGNGIELNLDWVPQRESQMTAYEMMLSESQERMLLVVKTGREQQVEQVCAKWGLHCVTIGRVTDDGHMRLFHHGQVVTDIPVDSLTEGAPVYHPPSREPRYFQENQQIVCQDIPVSDYTTTLHQLLALPSIASKEWVYRQYDYMVRTNTVVQPGYDAAVVRIRHSNKAIAVTTDSNAGYIYLEPRVGGAIAVAEAARNLVCTGATPLAITDCLNFGSPENPEIFWQLEQAVLGMADACTALGTPVVSGNVSLYNETKGQPIYPTPIVGMVGLIEDLSTLTTSVWKNPGDLVFLLGTTKAELGGSQLQKLQTGTISGRPPQIDLKQEQRLLQAAQTAIGEGWVRSAHDLAEGGLAVALAEMCMYGPYGVTVTLTGDLPVSAFLFGETQSRMLIAMDPAHQSSLRDVADRFHIALEHIGTVTDDQTFTIAVNGETIIATSVSQLAASWKEAIPCIMQT